jgi:gliding motility-associated-like protein
MRAMRNTLALALIGLPILASATTADFTTTTVCQGNNSLLVSISTPTIGQTIMSWDWDLDADGNFNDASGANLSHAFPGSGVFNVGLQVTTNLGEVVSVYRLVTVNPLPLAQFSAAPACLGDPILLSDQSTGATVVSVTWDLDNDGQYDDASGTNAQLTPPATGSFPVGLRVISDQGCAGVTSGFATVSPNATVNFAATGVCLGDVTTLTANASVSSGTIATYAWELNGDGQFDDATTATVQQQFIAAGNYQIGLTVTTDMGCTASVSQLMTIAPLPVALFTHSTACASQFIEFTNLSINQVGTATFAWDFGPFGTSTDSDPVTNAFNVPGPASVTLTITSSFGCTDDFTQTVNVLAAPIAAYTVGGICYGGESVFNNQSLGNGTTIAGYFWDFGDLNSSVGFNPIHVYPDAGQWNSMLVVTSTDGCRDTAYQTVEVYQLPTPQITADGPLTICAGTGSVTLTVNAGAGESILWSNEATTASTVVSEPDNYIVLLVSANGCEGRADVDLQVFPAATATASNDTSISIGNPVNLTATGGVSYEWSPQTYLNDPYSATPMARPTENMTYVVTVTDANGCTDQDTVSITLRRDFDLEAVNLFTPNFDGKNDRFYISNIEHYSECVLTVFDRWGNQVYTASPYLNDWNGTMNGNPLPEATYYYTLECDGLEDGRKDGAVTIVRLNK